MDGHRLLYRGIQLGYHQTFAVFNIADQDSIEVYEEQVGD